MTDDLPSDYDPEDSVAANGVEKCAKCGIEFRWVDDGVIDKYGDKHENLVDVDPGDKPYFCPDCWSVLEMNVKATENKSLTEFN